VLGFIVWSTTASSSVLSYFALKKVLSSMVPETVHGAGGSSFGGWCWGRRWPHPACLAWISPLILTRLWASSPCPHQILAPSMPSIRVRSQPSGA
jgi:hypothetical protein